MSLMSASVLKVVVPLVLHCTIYTQRNLELHSGRHYVFIWCLHFHGTIVELESSGVEYEKCAHYFFNI